MSDQTILLNIVIDGYEITEKLSEGGTAVIYLARNEADKNVVIKVLKQAWNTSEEAVQRFKREYEILKSLDHEHIIKCYGYGQYEEHHYLILEYMPYGDVSDKLQQGQGITLGGVYAMMAQLADALDYSHRKDIIHRDLKPSNILLRTGSHAVLTDFGIAGGTQYEQITTYGKALPGTALYMSPEQCRGVELTYQSDIYSFATVLYLLSVGRTPFQGHDAFILMRQQMEAHPPLPTSLRPELPSALDEVLLTGLYKYPEQRYNSALEMMTAYKQAIQGAEDILITTLSSSAGYPRRSSNFGTGGSQQQQSVLGPVQTPSQSNADAPPLTPQPGNRQTLFVLMLIPVIVLGVLILAILQNTQGQSISPTTATNDSSSIQSTATSQALSANAETDEQNTGGTDEISVAQNTESAATNYPTVTPTYTLTVSPSQLPDNLPVNTLVPTDTPEPTRTDTTTPIPTDTPEPTRTDTTTPIPTDTPEPTTTDTTTPVPTDTPEPTTTDTTTPVPTDTPEPTTTDTTTPVPTDTPEPTTTDTATPVPTDTPEPTTTDTATPVPTDTPEPTTTDTATPVPLTSADLRAGFTGTTDDRYLPSRFNCVKFSETFNYLREQLLRGDDRYEDLRVFIADVDNPVYRVQMMCLEQTSTTASIPTALFSLMRREVNERLADE